MKFTSRKQAHKPRHGPAIPAAASRLGALILATLAAVSFSLPRTATAEEEVAIHGFLSQGYLKTSGNNYLARTKSGSWEYAEAAVNFSKSVADDLSMGLQFFTRELGNLGNLEIELDWAFGDYSFRDDLSFRIGRIKMPYGLYGEIQDFDVVRSTVLLPQSVYYLAIRDLLVSFNGISIYGSLDATSLGTFDYQIFGGAVMIPNASESSIAYYFANEGYSAEADLQVFELTDVKNKYLIGAALKWETSLEGLLLNGTVSHYQAKATGLVNPAFTKMLETLNQKPENWTENLKLDLKDIVFSVASVQYNRENFTGTFEYARYKSLNKSNLAPIIPHSSLDQIRWYGQLEYRLSDYVQIATYYSYLYDKNDAEKVLTGAIPGHSAYMKDFAMSLRFDITDSWLLKLEAHYFDGTAQVYAIENKNHPNLERFWTLLGAKTTVTF